MTLRVKLRRMTGYILSLTAMPKRDALYAYVGLFLLVGLIVALGSYLKRRRRRALTEAGMAIGFTLVEDPGSYPIPEMPFFQNRGAEIGTMLSGTVAGFEAAVFDFSYAEGRSRVTQTAAAFRKPGTNIPLFTLHHRHLLDRISEAFAHPVKFPSNPAFSERYVVKGADNLQITQFFTPSILSFLEGMPPNEWTVEAYHDTVVVYRRRWRITPSALPQFVDDTGVIATGLLGQIAPTSLFR
jgi:hypothetical protein